MSRPGGRHGKAEPGRLRCSGHLPELAGCRVVQRGCGARAYRSRPTTKRARPMLPAQPRGSLGQLNTPASPPSNAPGLTGGTRAAGEDQLPEGWAAAMLMSQLTPNLSVHIPKKSPQGARSSAIETVPSAESTSQNPRSSASSSPLSETE